MELGKSEIAWLEDLALVQSPLFFNEKANITQGPIAC